MACRGVHSWTFSGLVCAFLDLAIAYCLLCASAFAFLASKFLGVFGLCLPCPCDGLFGEPKSNYCLRRLLVDCPNEMVSSVQLSVKTNFPFDSIWSKTRDCQLNLKLVRENNNNLDGCVEMKGEASCSWISNAQKSQNFGGGDMPPKNEMVLGFGELNSPDVKERRLNLKGKGVVNQRPKWGMRRRRKGLSQYEKFSSVSLSDLSYADVQGVTSSAPGVYYKRNEDMEDTLVPVDSGVDANCFHIMRVGKRGLQCLELNEPLDEIIRTENTSSPVEELKGGVRRKTMELHGGEKNVRILEQELEQEHAARTALYLELEKERSAAATAADEAMAMILRLQEEKASIEMEARQYQRIIEEKSAYDAEEMKILKEIIVRREREKHFLEKEVEAYRQMIYTGDEQLGDSVQSMTNAQTQQLGYSLDLSGDPSLVLHQLSESIDKKEIVTNGSDIGHTTVDEQNYNIASGNEFPIPMSYQDAELSKQKDMEKQFSCISRDGNNINQEFQEKGMISVDNNNNNLYAHREGHGLGTFAHSYESSISQKHNLLEKTVPLVSNEQMQNDNVNLWQAVENKTIESHDQTEICITDDGENLGQCTNDAYPRKDVPHHVMFGTEPQVHDVHVIDHESNLFERVSGKQIEWLSVNDSSSICQKNGHPSKASAVQRICNGDDCASTNRSQTEPDFSSNSSDTTNGLPPMCSSRGTALPSNLRSTSLSAVDNERLKIDSEVWCLRERLRIVQEGREKLNFSVEHREGEKVQLQLLEDIACQLREIRLLTEHGKAVRQASLPLPSSKVLSRKRRCRSASVEVHTSS